MRLWPYWRDALILVKPETVVAWHRQGFRLYWRWKSRAGTLGRQLGGMCRHILDRVDHLWIFLEHPDVEPTNNASERALRHAVIWRKLSFGTQSAAGSRFVETLLSVIETCRQQDRNVFAFVTHALQNHFAGQPHQKLLAWV